MAGAWGATLEYHDPLELPRLEFGVQNNCLGRRFVPRRSTAQLFRTTRLRVNKLVRIVHSARPMALLTPLSLETAQQIGLAYGLEVARIEPLSAGSVNSNFRLEERTLTRWFARVYEEQAEAGALSELRLLRELAQAKVPVVSPRARSDGRALSMVSGKPFAIFEWLDGEILCQARVTAEACRQVGENLARVHLATPQLTPLGAGRFGPEGLLARIDRIEQSAPPELSKVAPELRRKLEEWTTRRRQDLPQGVIHGDLFRDNVLFRNGELLALLDFESASHGPYAFDLAVTCLAWCFTDHFEAELITAMLDAYHRVRPLNESELQGLRAEAALACLRFAITRITDFSMRTLPGQTPARDYRRFLTRLEAVEAGAWEPALTRLRA